jgi:hypothetical protein
MKRISADLKYDPQTYVAKMKSPIGVYLRREVFHKEAKADSALKKKFYKRYVANQSADGSWDELFVGTANNLWDLALLGYEKKDENIKKGLDWLFSIQRHVYRGNPGFFYSTNRKDPSVMRSTLYGEFGPGCTIFYQTTYAVHLFQMLGLSKDKRVKKTVESYLNFWTPDWCGAWCTINVLRMLIEHPLSAKSKRVKNGVRHLANIQTKTGAWKGFPFYHTFHGLSRSNDSLAKKQLENSLPSVIRRQNKDGSWGKRRQETNTFLILDALKNVDVL